MDDEWVLNYILILQWWSDLPSETIYLWPIDIVDNQNNNWLHKHMQK